MMPLGARSLAALSCLLMGCMATVQGQSLQTTACAQYVITPGSDTIEPGTNDIFNHCDGCSTLIGLPFAVLFYDQAFTQVDVSSKGVLDFLGQGSPFTSVPSPFCLPVGSLNMTIFFLSHAPSTE